MKQSRLFSKALVSALACVLSHMASTCEWGSGNCIWIVFDSGAIYLGMNGVKMVHARQQEFTIMCDWTLNAERLHVCMTSNCNKTIWGAIPLLKPYQSNDNPGEQSGLFKENSFFHLCSLTFIMSMAQKYVYRVRNFVGNYGGSYSFFSYFALTSNLSSMPFEGAFSGFYAMSVNHYVSRVWNVVGSGQ